MSDSPQVVNCPKCHAAVRAGQQMAGSRVRCPSCNSTFKVPGIKSSQNDDDDWFDLGDTAGDKLSVAPDFGKPLPVPPAAAPVAPNVDKKPTVPVSAKPANADADDMLAKLAESIPAADNASDDLFSSADESQDSDPFSLSLSEAPRRQSTSIDDWLGTEDVVPDAMPEVPETEFRFPCPVCESAHYAKPTQVGKRIKCGDCTSMITVPEPPKIVPKYSPSLDTAATFELRESVHRPDQNNSPFTKSAADLLRDAESTQLDEDLDKLYENPDVAGWFRDVFSVFADPNSVMQFAVLTGICSAAMILWSFAEGVSPALAVLVGFGGLAICGVLLGTRYLTIMRSATADESGQSHWPYADAGGPLKLGGLVLVAALVASVPGQLIGAMLGEPMTLLWGVFVMLSVWGLMPIVLLSMLENGTMFGVYSQNVIKSFEGCMEPWGGMYFSSGLFFFAYFMLLAAPPYDGIIKSIITAFGLVGLAFIQSRMLGKVVQAIAETNEKSKPKSR
ncbi:hypothetical protein EC9_24810 [Rosistilla ulvae]|uniref:Uncharacterized protein n=1 Tax=Rosistilla ulvae TaxID=1930277 RepID=A0A517M092_9BACT|nr:hypothetical protein [Rosistilla ulvae]QDS88291.1 hypothetical protein EC9_24810 [Rosistilla ulvae]